MEEIQYSDNQLIETLPNAFARHKIITDADGKPADYIFLQVNAAFEKLTGLNREKIIGKRASEVLPDITKEPVDLIGTYAKAALDGESIVFEQYFRSFACWFEVKAYSDGIGYFSTIFDDITEKKKYFEAIQYNNEKMALLLDVSSTIAAKREPHALSQSIVEGMTKLTNMSSAAIYLIQDSKLRLEATFPPLPKDFPESLRLADRVDHPHINQAITSKHPVTLTDTLKAELTPEEKKVLEVRNLRSNLYVPLLYKDQCIGVLISSNADEVYTFSEEIIELSKILAGQSALAIIETRRTAELKQRLEEIEQKNDELQQTQKTLRQSEKKLSDILRFAETIAFVTTDDNEEHPRILDFSPGAEKIFGYKKEEVLGKEVAVLHTDEDVKRFPEVIQALRHKQEGFSGESILVRKNGEHFPALFKSHPMNDEQGNMKGTIGVSIDITDLKQAEEDKDKLQEQLAQSQKMEAVGQLAGGVAHDFNNMLSVILGYTDMLIEQLSASEQLSELFNDELQEVHTAAERSAGLTRQLLAFARQQTIEPEIVDLNQVISDLLNMLRRLIGEDIELSWIPGENLGKLLIDPSQIDQVLVNLCVNAREAISDTGRITIETSRVILTEEYCSTHAECSPGDYILLAVSDDGCGMEKETLSHIMEPFFTTKGPGKGTGLGLPTVFGIVKQNKGLIYVYSELNQGTTIKIYLPTAKTDQKNRSKNIQLPAARGSETILLADDDEMLRNLAVAMLKQLGYRVFAAATPQQASALIKEHKDIVLLITDVVMPEMNGKKLFETLRSELPHLQCLFMSGYTSNVIVHRGIVDEGVNFIQKPFSKQDLSIKIRQVLNLPPHETSK